MYSKQTIDLIFGRTSPSFDISGWLGRKVCQNRAKSVAQVGHMAISVPKSDFFAENDPRSIDRYYHKVSIQTSNAEISSTANP